MDIVSRISDLPKAQYVSCEKGVCGKLVHWGRLLLGLLVHENWLPFYEMVCGCVIGGGAALLSP
jgi:hypothetical protein